MAEDESKTKTAAVHTPGPWSVKPSNVSKNFCIYGPNGVYGVGEAWNLNDEAQNEANARLIAAAPDLLRLLIRYRSETPLGHQPHMIAHEADAVIAKATAQ